MATTKSEDQSVDPPEEIEAGAGEPQELGAVALQRNTTSRSFRKRPQRRTSGRNWGYSSEGKDGEEVPFELR